MEVWEVEAKSDFNFGSRGPVFEQGPGRSGVGASDLRRLDPKFDLAEFKQSIKAQAELVLQKADADKTLRESLLVLDAKSLYGNLMKDGNQPQDKFTALDVAIARERIDGMGVQVRWVEHQSMIVDALTKLGANPATLFEVIEKGTFRLVAEGDRLEERLRRRETGQVKRR